VFRQGIPSISSRRFLLPGLSSRSSFSISPGDLGPSTSRHFLRRMSFVLEAPLEGETEATRDLSPHSVSHTCHFFTDVWFG